MPRKAFTVKGGNAIPYAILRFEKHGSGGLRGIEAHHERQKDSYASNPDIDPSRSPHNLHLVQPVNSYAQEVEQRLRRIRGRAVRKDAVRLVDTLITASPQLFDGWSAGQVRRFFQRAVDFMRQEIGARNIISAVVHMDEKTPHMHLCFTPITRDNRLSAKEILGNRKRLGEWQDKYYAYMAAEYSSLERGQPAEVTGRQHVPTQLYKQAAHLDAQMEKILQSVDELRMTNIPKKREELRAVIAALIPQAESFHAQVNLLAQSLERLQGENGKLTASLQEQEDMRIGLTVLKGDLEKYKRVIENLPPEIQARLKDKLPKKERAK